MRDMGKYRGMCKDNGKWVKGYYIKDGKCHYIYPRIRKCSFLGNFIAVIPETVGQSTGLKDCKRTEEYPEGQEIYEGDIITLNYGIPPKYDTLVIAYADDEVVADIFVSGWWMRNIRKNGCSASLCKTYESDLEVIGNIHEEKP